MAFMSLRRRTEVRDGGPRDECPRLFREMEKMMKRPLNEAAWCNLVSELELPSDAVVFDIGAHRLQEAELLLPLLPDCRWYAFEPDPRSATWIRQTIAAEPERYGNVRLFELAVGSFTGRTTLYQSSGHPPGPPQNPAGRAKNPDGSQSSSIKKPLPANFEVWPWMRFDSTVEVGIVSLDDFCSRNNIQAIDLVKVDVQGAESDVFIGGQRILRRTRFIVTEHCPREYYDGMKPLSEQVQALPEGWAIREIFSSDALLENTSWSGHHPDHSR